MLVDDAALVPGPEPAPELAFAAVTGEEVLTQARVARAVPSLASPSSCPDAWDEPDDARPLVGLAASDDDQDDVSWEAVALVQVLELVRVLVVLVALMPVSVPVLEGSNRGLQEPEPVCHLASSALRLSHLQQEGVVLHPLHRPVVGKLLRLVDRYQEET